MSQQTTTRPLPHCLEAEEIFICLCILGGADVITRALAAGITSDSFYDHKLGIIFDALCALLRAGKPTDADVVADYLQTTKQLEQVGGYPFITQVSRLVPTTIQASHFIEKVRDLAKLRALIRAATTVVEECHEYSGDGVESLVEQSVTRIMAVGESTTTVSWKDSVASARDRIDRQLDPARAAIEDDAVSFGFPDLDHYFQPMRPGQVVVLAARPSVGKSSLARQIAQRAAVRAGIQVIFASLEVMGESLALNLAQTVTGISVRSLDARGNQQDAADFKSALDTLATPNLDVIAASNVSLASLHARARLLRAKGRPVKLVVIDYLQLMPDCMPTKGETRAASVGRVSRALKAFAIAEGCVVLVLSQLNRDSAKDGREPALHDLRESGDIEQDADKVLLLHRPAEHPVTGIAQPETSLPADVPSFYVNIIQAKGRDDGTGIVGLNFRRAITRFEQIHGGHQ